MEADPVADFSRVWAVVPIRGLETAKTRLGGGLDAEERVELVTWMLRRTLRATHAAHSIAGTVVVTMDPAAAGLAKEHGAIGLVELAPGLNPAIEAGRSVAVARGATAVLVLPADIPGVSAAAIDDLLAAPEVKAPLRLIQPKVMYEYADPELEARSAGQKIMMRIGHANAALIKQKLRAIRAELSRLAKTAPQ